MSSKKLSAEDEKFKTILKQSPKNKKRAMKNSKALNRSFIEKQIIKNEPNLTEFPINYELERTSTPNVENICEHCWHHHTRVRFFKNIKNLKNNELFLNFIGMLSLCR